MLHTKFRENRPAGSGEEDFWRVFTIYGRGSHFGHVTQMPRTNFRSPYPRRLHIKFGFDRASGFGEDVWNCLQRQTNVRRTPDHECPISSPMSLRLRWANNQRNWEIPGANIYVWDKNRKISLEWEKGIPHTFIDLYNFSAKYPGLFFTTRTEIEIQHELIDV